MYILTYTYIYVHVVTTGSLELESKEFRRGVRVEEDRIGGCVEGGWASKAILWSDERAPRGTETLNTDMPPLMGIRTG